MPKKPTIKKLDPKMCIACQGKGKASNGFSCSPCKGTGLKQPAQKLPGEK